MQADVPTGDIVSSDLNPLAGDAFVNPYPAYEELRSLGPIVWLRRLGVWGVFRDAQVREVVADHGRFGSKGGGGIANYYREKPWREPSVVFETDPPDHTRTRLVFTRVLSPGALNKLRQAIEAEAEAHVAKVVAMGTFDVMTDLAHPFPIKILPDAVGLPQEGRENLLVYNSFVRRGRAHNWRNVWTDEDHREGERISAWVADHCKRETLSNNGFGAQIYAAADTGEISHHEAANMIRSFLAAGVETTINGIAHTINLLAAHPDQWDLVKADPSKVRGAFDEMLRYDSAVQIIARNTLDAIDFHGTRLGRYDKVIAFIGSANRDPARWDKPDAYDIRRGSAGHLALGTGIHGCVGQMMARMEASALIGAFVRAVDAIEPVSAPVWRTSGARGLVSLKVRVTPSRGLKRAL